MAQNTQRIGWIGMGRMGYPMAERLLKAGYDVSIWNRTKSKAEPLAKSGGKIVDKLSDLSGMDIVFSIVAEGKDVEQVYFGKDGVLSGNKTPARVRRLLDHRGRGVGRDPQAPQGARRRLRLRAGHRQRQGDQGRQAVVGLLRPGGGIQEGRGDDQGVRAEGRRPTSATASSRASARSRTTSCSAW